MIRSRDRRGRSEKNSERSNRPGARRGRMTEDGGRIDHREYHLGLVRRDGSPKPAFDLLPASCTRKLALRDAADEGVANAFFVEMLGESCGTIAVAKNHFRVAH